MRPGADVKMGYYPTPISVVERIRSFLNFPDDNVNLLDPCCGEGLALKKLQENSNATTYGIELDQYRAEKAKDNLDHIIKGSYEDARISHNAFSCLYLNPPYDWDAVNDGERKEKTFLKGTLKYLQPTGLLVYLISQNRLADDVAKVLSYRLENFSVFRFPDREYKRFRQIVLFGCRKNEAALDDCEFEKLRAIPYKELQEIPCLNEPIYSLHSAEPVELFRSSLIDEEELERDLESSILWKKINANPKMTDGYMGRPPLPLHKGHIGLLLANGCLDGVVGEGPDRHIVRGKVEKMISKYEEYEGDTLIEREVESYKVSLKILKRDGDIMTLI